MPYFAVYLLKYGIIMIHYLKIRNFGPILDEVEINFEAIAPDKEKSMYEVEMPDGRRLLRMAYIFGPNASGKTSVLKAFNLLRTLLLSPLDSKMRVLPYEPFLFCKDPYTNPSYLEWAFYFEETRYVYQLTFGKDSVYEEKLVYYKTAKATEVFSRKTDVAQRYAHVTFGGSLKVPTREKDLLESNTLHNNTVFGSFLKTNVKIPQLEGLCSWMNDYLLEFVDAHTNLKDFTALQINKDVVAKEWISKYLQKADRQIADVVVEDEADWEYVDIKKLTDLERVERATKRIKFLNKRLGELKIGDDLSKAVMQYISVKFIHKIGFQEKYELDLHDESSGSQRYFGLGGVLYKLQTGSRFACIDELEASLHHDLMKHFLQIFLLGNPRSQLLFTTHNLAFMLEQDFIRNDALWFTEKSEKGGVELFSAADFDSKTLRKGASVANAYKLGKLGGKPNLGSPYF